MIRALRLLAPTVALLFVASACSSGSDEQSAASPATLPAQTTQALESQLTKTMERNDVPGGVVEVCVPGYENWATAQGVANIETGEPMATDMVWPLRSITKSFTVTLLLQLVDEGRLSLDDTIDQWVPGVPNGDEITLGQLAEMSSGVPEYTNQAWFDAYIADPQRDFTAQELIDYALEDPAQFEPGTKHVYVNTSTVLLGEVVSQEYGKPLGEVVSEQILVPLGLDQTTYPETVDDWSGPHPTGYQPNADGELEAQDNNFSVFAGAGAMTSTMSDLCTWGDALGEGTLLKPETQQARLDGTPLDQGPEYDVYGEGIGTLNGWVGHTGEGFGYTVLVMHDPDSGATVAVGMNISNKGKHVPTRYFRKIAPIVESVPPAGS